MRSPSNATASAQGPPRASAVNDVVRDKDGISAALLMYQVAAAVHEDGISLTQCLDEGRRRPPT